MNILVTGHNGFIGRSIVKLLSEENHVFVLKVDGRENTVPAKTTVIHFDENKVDEFIENLKGFGIDGIIHLASKFVVKHKSEQVAGLIDSNLRFGSIILDAAVNAQIKWFINTGTFWQFYKSKEFSPVNLYSAIKQGFQSIAQFYVETHSILFVTLILFDTYGPGDNRPKLLNMWDRISRTGETLKMTGGDQVMKINYIDEVAGAYVILAKILQNNPGSVENGQLFSLDTIENYTLKQLASVFEEAVGRKLNIDWGANPYRDREIMEPENAGEKIPGWEPKVPVGEGFKKSFLI